MTTKTITIETESGERYDFETRPLLGRQLLAINCALARRPELLAGGTSAELSGYCRALEIVKACADRFSGPSGNLAVCEENLLDLPPSVVIEAALAMQGPRADVTESEAGALGN